MHEGPERKGTAMRYVAYWLGVLAFGAVLVGGLWLVAPATLAIVVQSLVVLIAAAGWFCAKHGPYLGEFFAARRPGWWERVVRARRTRDSSPTA